MSRGVLLNPLQEPREWHDLVNRLVRERVCDLRSAVNFRNQYRHSGMTPAEIFDALAPKETA